MKKAFLETTVFNKALNENVEPQKLLAILKKWDASPVIGTHVLYEIQKCFLYSDHRQKAMRLLDYCLELQPGLITTTNDLWARKLLALDMDLLCYP